jgi:hypothetical protein
MGIVVLALAIAGCGLNSDADLTTSAAAARAKAQPTWKIQLETATGTAEDEENESEIFEMYGPDAMLVGVFPSDLHVGYGSEYARAVDRRIAIQPTGGDPREPKTSWVRLDGVAQPVAGGELRIEKVTGKWEGSEGDRTYWGTVELRIPTSTGERTVRGKFAVNCVTWG